MNDIAKLRLVKRSKDDLQKLLVDSVERASTLKEIDRLIEFWETQPPTYKSMCFVNALDRLRETISKGEHVK